jgi:hypothetical protein
MAFREPKRHDEVCVFGYPYVPGLTERPITVERGHIVHPAAEACGVDGYPRQKTFLTSAVARPGNSGGPMVAQDGHVIGLVVRSGREGRSASTGGAQSTGEPKPAPEQCDSASPDIDPDSPSFYRGIPAGLVVRAISSRGPTPGRYGSAAAVE